MELKPATCIECGTSIMVSKFMSLKKAKCAECKGQTTSTEAKEGISVALEASQGPRTGDTPAKAKEDTSPSLAGIKVHPQHGRIDKKPNGSLRKLMCPYGCAEMEVLMVIDSGKWGDSLAYQCMNCRAVVQIMDADRNRPILRGMDSGIDLEEHKERMKRGFAGGQPKYDTPATQEEE